MENFDEWLAICQSFCYQNFTLGKLFAIIYLCVGECTTFAMFCSSHFNISHSSKFFPVELLHYTVFSSGQCLKLLYYVYSHSPHPLNNFCCVCHRTNNFILPWKHLNAGNTKTRSASLGLTTRKIWHDKYLLYISYGE